MKDLVSIIIPTYNRKDLLVETLKSVANQSYKNWECVVVDDGSTDGTDLFMEKYGLNRPKIKYFKRPENLNAGAAACRNFGIEQSKGEYIQFLDSDDVLGVTKLEEQVKLLIKQGGTTILTCKWGYFTEWEDRHKRFKYEYHCYQNFTPTYKLLQAFGKYNEFFPPHVYLFPRAILKKAGKWNEELTNNDDAEFFLRVILSASQIIFVPQAEVFYRLHHGTKLSDLDGKEKFKQAIKSWEYMEDYLKSIDKGKVGAKYIKSGKRVVYNLAMKKAPDLIEENHTFFKDVIPMHKRLFKKLF